MIESVRYATIPANSNDAAGNRRFLRLNDVDQFDHRSDSANRLQKIIDKQNSDATIDFNYDSANRLTRIIRPNGVDTVYRYDGMSRLTVLRDFTVAAPTPAINHRALAYNSASQISNITNKQDNRTFNYDTIDRLTGVTGSATENYAYDQVGNRTSSHQSATYTTAGFNKLTATANATYTYDANGNMTSKVDTSGTWTYEWDFENRLKKVSRPDGQNVVYRYDGLGRRVERLPSNGVSTKFIYDGLNVFVDQNSDGSSVKYINSLSIDNKMGRIVNGNTQYFLRDHLGSTNDIIDSAGTSLESTTYDAYGKAATNLSTRYQFTGRESDDFSGLQFSRNRWYSSEVGRFISEDPVGFGGGDANLYGYVWNQPLLFRDSLGLRNDPITTAVSSPDVQEGFSFAAQTLSDPATRTAVASAAVGGAAVAKTTGAAAVAYGGTSVAAAGALPVVAVVGGGFAIGYGIGTGATAVGNYTASLPSNPFVTGPLNPFAIWNGVSPLPANATQPGTKPGDKPCDGGNTKPGQPRPERYRCTWSGTSYPYGPNGPVKCSYTCRSTTGSVYYESHESTTGCVQQYGTI